MKFPLGRRWRGLDPTDRLILTAAGLTLTWCAIVLAWVVGTLARLAHGGY